MPVDCMRARQCGGRVPRAVGAPARTQIAGKFGLSPQTETLRQASLTCSYAKSCVHGAAGPQLIRATIAVR